MFDPSRLSAGPKRAPFFWILRNAGLALIAVALATGVLFSLDALFRQTPFGLFIVAVAVCAVLGALPAAIPATFLGLLAGWFFFVSPRLVLVKTGTPPDWIRVTMYLILSLVVSLFGAAVERWRTQARRVEVVSRQAESVIRESEERYRFLAEGLPQFVWSRDRHGRLTYLNRHWEHYTGLSIERGIDAWFDPVHPDDREPVQRARSFASHKEDLEFEFRLHRASDDSYRWHLAREKALADPNGNTLWVGLAVDIDDRKRAEDAVGVAEEKFRTIVQSAAEGIWIVTLDGFTTFVNPRIPELLGYETDEIVGHSCFLFVHPDDEAAGREGFHRRRNEGYRAIREYRFVRKDKEVIWLSFVGSPIYDAAGSVTGILLMCTDTTDRRRSQERILQLNEQLRGKVAELETLLSVVPVGIVFSHDPESKGASANLASQRIFGIGPNVNPSKTGPDAHRLPYRVLQNGVEVPTDELPMQVSARTGKMISDAECDIARDDGITIPVLCSAAPLFDSESRPRGSVLSMVDISERKNMENALRRANAALEQFAYAAAHDLQEPVRNISIFTQKLARSYTGRIDAETDQIIQFIIQGSRRIQNLIQDLLSYTRATDESDSSEARCDASLALEEVVQNLRTAIDMTNAQITYEALPEVAVRHAHLIQLMQNLISNSLKYHGPQSPMIHVAARRQAFVWTFIIKDNGAGIPPEHHERIFRVFKRLHSRDIPGTGIGLAICERIVTHYGGRIWVESEAGRGATFHFTLPAATRMSS